MENQPLTIEEVHAILNNWVGKQMTIEKLELQDKDETTMILESVSYEKNKERLDHYTSDYYLQLNGNGSIDTFHNNAEPLPLPTYEIPLEDQTVYQYHDRILHILNDRGQYTIHVDS
jgi:hypothetical protein